MFCPSHCANNALFFVGKVCNAFSTNYDYGTFLKNAPKVFRAKRASTNPRGDIYTPRRRLAGEERYDVGNFLQPPSHVRSTEKSKDGTPKWWKDVRYSLNNKRPPVLMYNPSYLFSRPHVHSSLKLGRATRKMTVKEFADSLVVAH